MSGDRKSTKKGAGLEFADYREMAPGDDLRRVDWNLYARTEKLFLKLYQLDEDRLVTILLDCSASMEFGAPNKSLYALQTASALLYLGLKGMDRVRLAACREGLVEVSPILRGRQDLHRGFSWLSGLDFSRPGNLSDGLNAYLAREPRPGLAIILSDFMEEAPETGLKGFSPRGFDTVLIQTLAHEEVNPSLVGDLKLIDAETQSEVEVTVSPQVLKAYKESFKRHEERLRDACRRQSMRFIPVTTSLPLEELFLKTLVARGVVQ